MQGPFHIEDLEIIGYADVLMEALLPSVVPPVFRVKAELNRIILPPYLLNDGFVCNATEVAASELEGLRGAGKITLFDQACPAHRDFELWIDQGFKWQYQPLDEAERNLKNIALAYIAHANAAFDRRDFAEAERCSGAALSADDARLEPLIIKAAVCRTRGDRAGEQMMAKLAARSLERNSFGTLVDAYCASLQQHKAEARPAAVRYPPMRDMGRMRPAA